jgi:hypothetical protein
VREKYIAEFEANNCWDYVNPEEGQYALFEDEDDEDEEPEIEEVQLDSLEPIREEMVTQKLAAYEASIENWYNQALTLAATIVDDDDRISRLTKIEEIKLEKTFAKSDKEDNYIKQYEDAKKRHETRKEDFAAKVSRVLKIFTKFFKDQPLAIIREDLEKRRFRAAWNRLNKTYLTEESEAIIKMMANQGILQLKYEESKGLEQFVYQFTTLWKQTGSDDVFAKVGYFKHCLENSKSNPFKETISHLHIQGFVKFEDIVDVLYRKEMEHRNKRDFRQMTNTTDQQAFVSTEDDTEQKVKKVKQSNQQANLVNNTNNKQDKSKLTCTHCNKGGHTRATCFDLVPCPICGGKGHGRLSCKNKDKGGKGGSGTSNSNKTTSAAPKVRDDFRKKLFKAKVT